QLRGGARPSEPARFESSWFPFNICRWCTTMVGGGGRSQPSLGSPKHEVEFRMLAIRVPTFSPRCRAEQPSLFAKRKVPKPDGEVIAGCGPTPLCPKFAPVRPGPGCTR